jgi:hypothetical protein
VAIATVEGSRRHNYLTKDEADGQKLALQSRRLSAACPSYLVVKIILSFRTHAKSPNIRRTLAGYGIHDGSGDFCLVNRDLIELDTPSYLDDSLC